MSEINPCDISCPKCGSVKVGRRFTAKGEVVRSYTYGKPPNQFVTGAGAYNWTAERDHIHNHCSSCQYGWGTLPLKSTTTNRVG